MFDPVEYELRPEKARLRAEYQSIVGAWPALVYESCGYTRQDCFRLPENLSIEGLKAAIAIVRTLEVIYEGPPDSGACTSFYSPSEWKARDEEYGLESELIVVYDGGDLHSVFDGEFTGFDMTQLALDQCDLFFEHCTCWYGAIYKAPHNFYVNEVEPKSETIED